MKARRLFWDGLATLLAAGIPVRTALADLAGREGGDYGEALRHLREQADRGRPLADAMAERPGAFRRLEVELVRAAETSGTIDRAARALADDEEASEKLARRVLVGVAYPLFLLHFCVVPLNIGELVQGRLGVFARNCILMLLPLWALLGLLAWLHAQARSGSAAAGFLLRIPFVGGLLRDAAFVRWGRVLAAMDDAGLGADRTAEGAAAATGLASLEAALAAPAARLRTGTSRADAYAGTPLPRELYTALCTGETSGAVGPSVRRAADILEHQVQTRIDAAVKLLPAFAIVLVGVVVLFVMLQVVGGYYGQLDRIK